MSGLVHIVDDDAEVRTSLTLLLQAFGFEAREHESGDAFLARPRPNDDDVIVLDLRMPGKSGLDVLSVLRAEGVCAGVIIVTGHAGPEAINACTGQGVLAFLEKPFDPMALIDILSAR